MVCFSFDIIHPNGIDCLMPRYNSAVAAAPTVSGHRGRARVFDIDPAVEEVRLVDNLGVPVQG